jgi:hypothetical protein
MLFALEAEVEVAVLESTFLLEEAEVEVAYLCIPTT